MFCCCLVLCVRLSAQHNIAGGGPVKLSDVIAAYQKAHPDYGKKTNGVLKTLLPGLPRESREKDAQFDHWLWYWKQHVDANGYLVSAAKTWEELQKEQARSKTRSAERTTSGVSAAWTFVGPDSSEAGGEGVGRINLVSFHPTDVNTYWIGSAGGGAWKTTNNGMSWTCMTDQLPDLGVGGIIFNPLNPNTVYLLTGDRDAGDYSSIGVLKSYDGGTTWNPTGMTWPASQYNLATSMIINPADTNSLILATSVGIFRSYDGGATFNLVNAGTYKQVVYKPNDTNTVYAASYISYSSTVSNAEVWKSTDAGTTWTQQTNWTTTDRVTIAVTPAAPNMVMVVGSKYDPTGTNSDGLDGIYKSSDAGNTFTEIYTGDCTNNLLTWDVTGNGCGGQGWYTLPLAISFTDSNKIFTGGVNTWGSSDGGLTWTLVNEESPDAPGVAVIHADKHWMAFNPLLPTRFFETNDGGIYSSDDPTATGVWNNLTNRMGIEEIYRTSVTNIENFAIVGAQDVGTKIVKPAGLFEIADGGDGMACLLDYVDNTVGYASSEYGYIDILNPSLPMPIVSANDISANILSGTVEGNGGWVTPFILEPTCHSCILAGYAGIYKSSDMGNTWHGISGNLTSGDLSRVVTTTADSNTIFATDDASSENIYYTHDGGSTWTTMVPTFAGGQYITDIKVDPRDKNHIWITYGGYGGTQVAEWKSTSGWAQINAGLPDVPVECFAIDYLSRDIYVGTEIGVYYRDSTMTSWAPYNTGMPSVMVSDIEINYATNELWAATYGRSLWKSPKHTTTTLPTSVMSIVPFVADGVTISPNPNHGSFTVTVKNIADKQVTMRLTDNNGKLVWQGNGILKGSKLDVNIPGLVAGTYIFEIASEKTIEGKQKVVIY